MAIILLKIDFINYLAVVFVSYLGLLAGIIISYFTKEELAPGKKHFVAMQNLLVFGVFLAGAYVRRFPWVIWILFGALVILIWNMKNLRHKSALMYLFFAVIIWIASFEMIAIQIVASMIFLAGIPTGSLLIKKKIIPILISHAHYLIICLVLFLI